MIATQSKTSKDTDHEKILIIYIQTQLQKTETEHFTLWPLNLGDRLVEQSLEGSYKSQATQTRPIIQTSAITSVSEKKIKYCNHLKNNTNPDIHLCFLGLLPENKNFLIVLAPHTHL